MADDRERVLSDADIEAIADLVLEKLENKVYHDFGKGVWSIVSKVLLTLLLALAAYGAVTGGKLQWPSSTP